MTVESYPDGRAFVQALKESAKATHPDSLRERIQQLWFDRFLSRVFASEAREDWTLKGGMGLLARVSGGRGTRDIDFVVTHKPIDAALDELSEIARTDLGDHVAFEMYRTGAMIEGQGSHITGRRVYFAGYADGKEQCRFHVDVVVAPPPIGKVEVLVPPGRAEFKREVPVASYRVFPIEDHLAEKVASVLAHVRGDENTRVKDLVDVLVIARTQDADFETARRALDVTLQRANAVLPREFSVPASWRQTFPAEIEGTILEGADFDSALEEAREYLAPFLPSSTHPSGLNVGLPEAVQHADLAWDQHGRLISPITQGTVFPTTDSPATPDNNATSFPSM